MLADTVARTNKPKGTRGNRGWITQETMQRKPLHDGMKKRDVALLGQSSKCEEGWCMNTSPWSGHKCSSLQVAFHPSNHPSIHPLPPSGNMYPIPGRVLGSESHQLTIHNPCLPRVNISGLRTQANSRGAAHLPSTSCTEARPAIQKPHGPPTVSVLIKSTGLDPDHVGSHFCLPTPTHTT